MNKARIDEFESLRGLMSLWVVLGHVTLTFALWDGAIWWKILNGNRKAVDIFIILSGFVIFFMLDKKKDSYGLYLARRFLRLFPAYLLCLIAGVLMVGVSMDALSSLSNATPRDADRIVIFQNSLAYFWPELLAHLTMLHGLLPLGTLPYSDYAFIGQGWSISVEWQFYLIAPLCFFLATDSNRWIGLPLLAAICAVLFGTHGYFEEGYIGTQVLCFVIGAASFFVWRMRDEWLEKIAKYSDVAIVAFCGLWLGALPHQAHIAIWFMVLMSCIAVRFEKKGVIAPLVSRFLLLPPLRWLGRISYSVYLVHMFMLYGALALLSHSSLSATGKFGLVMAITVAATLVVAEGMHRWVEIPGIALGRRLRQKEMAKPPMESALAFLESEMQKEPAMAKKAKDAA